jgi:hypothetical protein
VIGQLDLVFLGLDGCFADVLGARAGRVIVTEICDPDRVRRQGVEGLRGFVARRGVALSSTKAAQVVDAARVALRLAGAERAAPGQVLAADVSLLASVEAEITAAEAALGEVLAATPAGILTTLPRCGSGASVELPGGHRRPSPIPNRGGRRAAGLVPTLYESAKRSRPGSAHQPGRIGRITPSDH